MGENMIRRSVTINILLALCFVLVSVSVFVAQTPSRPTAADDFKVKYKVTMGDAGAGQTTESVTMIKGARERSENHSGSGYDLVNITQCDLKRTIQLSDSAKKYIVTPMEAGDTSATTSSASGNPSSGTARRGGVVTYTTSSVDTGERKEMFGFTARHVKSSTTIESSPDACNVVKQRTELDGWYIDLNVAFDCQLGRPPVVPNRDRSGGGCQDQTRFRREGVGRLGYPLIETMRMFGDKGQLMFSTTKEVVELSRAPLDIALFEVPAGYTEAASMQELYGMPSMAGLMGSQGQPGNTATANAAVAEKPVEAKQPGTIRIGVVQINNKASRPVSQEALRQRLIGQIQGGGLEAVSLNASSQMEAEPEAKAKQCDFILYTDIASLKVSKLGGMFGQVTGVGGVAKTEAKVEFKLVAVGENAPRLQSSTTAKVEGDEASAGTAIDVEAKLVIAEARRKGRG
jgi:hypothetical protein